MVKAIRQLDSILRGDATRVSALQEGEFRFPIAGLTLVVVALGVIYGMCMGSFALIRTGGAKADGWYQFLASACKVPMLFLLTLLVTFPSLYVFNALVGSRLSMIAVLRLLIAALGVMLAVLASLGPIVVFFSVSTESYHFMMLLNVAVCTVCGVLGLAFLLRTLHRLVTVQEWLEIQRFPLTHAEAPARIATPESIDNDVLTEIVDDGGGKQVSESGKTTITLDNPPGALDRVGESTSVRAKAVFRIWVIVFSLVGAQMSWVLRPFIGHPGKPFEFFREREGNFFIAVVKSLETLFGG